MAKQNLIKIIQGYKCEVFATIHHSRIRIGEAVPTVKVWEWTEEVPTLDGNSCRYRDTFFLVSLCPGPEMGAAITADTMKGLTSFDLLMYLEREENTFVPFDLYDVSGAELTDDEWKFRVEDYETLKRLLNL